MGSSWLPWPQQWLACGWLLGLQPSSARKPRSVEVLPREVWRPFLGVSLSCSFQAATTKPDLHSGMVVVLGAFKSAHGWLALGGVAEGRPAAA